MRPTRPVLRASRLLPALCGVVAATLLSGCGPDNAAISQTLEDKVAAMPGVAHVEHDYRRNDGTNGSWLDLEVEMSPTATPGEVEEVVWRTYRAFRDHHDYDNPEAQVTLGEGTVEFGPASSEATDEQIQQAAEDAVARLFDGEPLVTMEVETAAG